MRNKPPIAAPQWNKLTEDAGNIAEAPPVADKARRCWRKTRSIAPAPRAIGDYVLRGLNGVLCTPHEPALVQAPARLRANVPSCLLRRATYVLRRGVRGVSGRSRPQRGEQVSVLHSMAQKDLLLSGACLPSCGHSLLFFCRRFLFQTKRKCRNAVRDKIFR